MLVLVVDDDPFIIRAMAKLLPQWGHTMCSATSGESALVSMVTEEPDVVLLDINLGPGKMSGWDVAREKLLDERIRAIPVIVVTGIPIEDVRSGANVFSNALAGTTLILGKPIEPRTLERALTHLEKHSSPPAVE